MRKNKPVTPPAKPAPGTPPPAGPLNFGPMRTSGDPLLSPFIAAQDPLKPIIPAVAGLDISFYQPKVNWKEVLKAGFEFCIAKASDGVGTKDSMFDTHRKNATENGIIFGAYHFMRFGGLDAKTEAANFLKYTGGVRKGELPLTLDIEWDRKNPKYDESSETMDEAAASEALEILERLEDATQVTPFVYCSYPFFRGFKNPERFFRFLPWNPAYYRDGSNGHKVNRITGPKTPLPWSKTGIWQWTDEHPAARAIVGNKNLDGDYFAGTLEQLRSLTK